MSAWSRRDVIRASAGAAVAVPLAAAGGASTAAAGDAAPDVHTAGPDDGLDATGSGPMMCYVPNTAGSKLMVMQGTSEVAVHDRALVTNLIRAFNKSVG